MNPQNVVMNIEIDTTSFVAAFERLREAIMRIPPNVWADLAARPRETPARSRMHAAYDRRRRARRRRNR